MPISQTHVSRCKVFSFPWALGIRPVSLRRGLGVPACIEELCPGVSWMRSLIAYAGGIAAAERPVAAPVHRGDHHAAVEERRKARQVLRAAAGRVVDGGQPSPTCRSGCG